MVVTIKRFKGKTVIRVQIGKNVFTFEVPP